MADGKQPPPPLSPHEEGENSNINVNFSKPNLHSFNYRISSASNKEPPTPLPPPLQEEVEKFQTSFSPSKATYASTLLSTAPIKAAKVPVYRPSTPTITYVGSMKIDLNHRTSSTPESTLSQFGNGFLRLQPTTFHQGKPSVVFNKSDKIKLLEGLKHVLIAKFSHGRPALKYIQQFFNALKIKGDLNVSILDSKHVIIVCGEFEDFAMLWIKRSWNICGFVGRFFKWNEHFNPALESSISPVWFHLPALPLYLFDEWALLRIANAIGRPLYIDKNNITKRKLGYASICVELDVSIAPVDKIWIEFDGEDGSNSREGFWQKVVFDHIPNHCSFCHHLGHSASACKRFLEDSKGVVQACLQHKSSQIILAAEKSITAGDFVAGGSVAGGFAAGGNAARETEASNVRPEQDQVSGANTRRPTVAMPWSATLEFPAGRSATLENQAGGEGHAAVAGTTGPCDYATGETHSEAGDSDLALGAAIPAGAAMYTGPIGSVTITTAESTRHHAAAAENEAGLVQKASGFRLPAGSGYAKLNAADAGVEPEVEDADPADSMRGNLEEGEILEEQIGTNDTMEGQIVEEHVGAAPTKHAVNATVFESAETNNQKLGNQLEQVEPFKGMRQIDGMLVRSFVQAESVPEARANDESHCNVDGDKVQRVVAKEQAAFVAEFSPCTVAENTKAGGHSWAVLVEKEHEEAVGIVEEYESPLAPKKLEAYITSPSSWADQMEEQSDIADLDAGETSHQIEAAVLVEKEVLMAEEEKAEEEEKEEQIRIVSQLSPSEVKDYAKKEMEKIWNPPNRVAQVLDTSTSNPYILDKEGRPAPCSEVIRKSMRLAVVRSYVDKVKQGNTSPALKEKATTLKEKWLYDKLMHMYTEQIHLTIKDHQQTNSSKDTSLRQEMITHDSADEKD